ncbi:MAG: hypothetical protein SGI89_14705 [bacterium]|nr:hypothetical protein [bacterium]
MFEKFVLEKITKENEIIGKIVDAASMEGMITKTEIVNSRLSDFTKNYLFNEASDKINQDEFDTKIEKSNKLYFNYTIRPKWTMLTFLFNNFESRPPNEIIRKLDLFPFYTFYIDSIKNFISDNSPIFCTKGEITSIIDRTNKAIESRLSEDINHPKIKNFFLQVFKLKYESEDKINLESTIPYSFVKIFLEDKSLENIEKKFHSVKGINDEYEINLKDIIKVMTDKYAAKEPEDVKIITPEVKAEVIIKAQAELPGSKTPEKPIANESKNIKKPGVPKITEKKEIYSSDLIKADERKKSQDTEVKNVIDQVNLKYNVKDLFNDKLLEKISVKVYNSDLIYRDKSFGKLSNYKTWFEASNHLKEIFKINSVEIYNKDVISFVDILNDYYRNKE